MARIRRLWVPVLVGLLVAGLLGPAGGAAAEPRTVTASIMIPASAFIPATQDDYPTNYYEYGSHAYGYGGDYSLMAWGADWEGMGHFMAPLTFPVPVVNLRRITAYAYDNGLGYDICLSAVRVSPATGGGVVQGTVCTEDSTADPQIVSTSDITPRLVDTTRHGAYLWVDFNTDGNTSWFYGVKVTYTYESGT